MKTLTRDDTVHGEEYVRKADALAEIDAAARREIERCAALCLRPFGWLSVGQQNLAEEIRNAILGHAGRLVGKHEAQPKPAPALLTDEEIDSVVITNIGKQGLSRAIESAVLRKNGWGG